MRVSVWFIALGLAIPGARGFVLEARDNASNDRSGGQTKEAHTAPTRMPQVSHRFWDSTNAALFAGAAGARALDYASTQRFRNKGINERLLTNSVVDNKPLFAVVEAAGVGASIAISYLFHKTGHHKLERWISIVHISVGVGGSIRNYALKPDQSLPPR